MKLAVVGGASTYTPELVDGLARLREALPVDDLVLLDPNAERLAVVGGFATRIFARHGHPGRIRTTARLAEAVDGADAVLLQLRVGGQAARAGDEAWPLECGCLGQETTGAGGLAKALRTVPVVLDIADRVRRANPAAWIVDFTNPVGIVTRALLQAGHRALGLCNSAIGLQRYFAGLLDVPPAAVSLGHVGLNHLTWERQVWLRREAAAPVDVLPELLREYGTEIGEHQGLPPSLLRRLGVVPSSYLRYFYAHDAAVEELRRSPSRASRVAAIERELLETYADPALDTLPALLTSRGGAYYSEAAVELLAGLLGEGAGTQVVNLRNGTALPFLPEDAVVEVPATVGRTGAAARPLEPLEPLFAGLVAHTFSYERLALDAALYGGRERVFRALLAHPLVGQIDLAEGLTDRLLAHNADYLPWA